MDGFQSLVTRTVCLGWPEKQTQKQNDWKISSTQFLSSLHVTNSTRPGYDLRGSLFTPSRSSSTLVLCNSNIWKWFQINAWKCNPNHVSLIVLSMLSKLCLSLGNVRLLSSLLHDRRSDGGPFASSLTLAGSFAAMRLERSFLLSPSSS